MCHPHGLWKSSLPSIVPFGFSISIFFPIWNLFLYQYLIIGAFPFFKAWFVGFLSPFCSLKILKKKKKCFSNCCYHLTPYKRGYTVYIMMVCRTTTWTLGKNIWTIVFIWARTFLLPIKQPSSYKCVFSSTCSTFQPPSKAGCSREPPRAAFHVSTLLASHHFVRIISLLWVAACETELSGAAVTGSWTEAFQS